MFVHYGTSVARGSPLAAFGSSYPVVCGASLKAPSFVPSPTQAVAFTRHSIPSGLAFRSRTCTILWLRIGHFRMGDNPAVTEASEVDGSLLPVITVQLRHLSAACVSAICELKETLEQLGSTLIVRVTRNFVAAELQSLHELAAEVQARFVIVNEYSGIPCEELNILRCKGIHVRKADNKLLRPNGPLPFAQGSCHDFLSESPMIFPQPPAIARDVSSDFTTPDVVARGEKAARARLSRLLSTAGELERKRIPLPLLVSFMSEELNLGCISYGRLLHEFRAKPSSRSIRSEMITQTRKTFFSNFFRTPVVSAFSIAAYDVNGGDRRGVEWDEGTKSFRLKEWEHTETERRMSPKERWHEFWRRRRLFFTRSFFPDDVTPDYYSFTAWRFAQRCVSATIGVFGTSSLLFALGIRSGRIGQAAVISWVLKDGLGRVGKMIWAGSMGKDFDVDPKRWRFRSALLYALGNGLEIVTQIFPASFLVFATAANSMKQVSMLTSSATRNAMYRSFGGRSQNIANITAKGEAQIVVADLIGMGCGIRLSKILGSSKQRVLGTYLALTVLDIFGIYMELRQVVFRTLNAERSTILVSHYMSKGEMLSPSNVSPKERIFLKPFYKSQVRLSSIAKAANDPEELDLLLRVFRREHFLVATPAPGSCGPCRLVLRKNASNEDVLRAILMIGYVRRSWTSNGKKTKEITREEQELILRNSWRSANRNFKAFHEAARSAGWSTDNLLFSTMKRRGDWGRDRS